MATLTPAQASDLFRRPPDRFLDLGGNAGEAAYRRVGHGPDALFVHGWPVSSATFRTLLPYLAEHVTCHLFDFPGAGDSRFTADTTLSMDQHIATVRRVVDMLALPSVAVVGHDSGGMIARLALAGDPRVRAMGMIDTEQPQGLSWRFRSFIANRNVPGFGGIFGWVCGKPAIRRNRLLFGDVFVDRSHLDGEFDEFFLQPLRSDAARRAAAVRVLRSFEVDHVRQLADAHRRITVPVQLVWGAKDRFFPVARAKEMVTTFPDARLTVIDGASVFSHEERPAEVAAALLPTLTGSR
jgi:haloalkane dehalogenase